MRLKESRLSGVMAKTPWAGRLFVNLLSRISYGSLKCLDKMPLTLLGWSFTQSLGCPTGVRQD